MTPRQAARRYGGNAEQWQALPFGAVARKSVALGDRVQIRGPAVFLDGVFRGGIFYGGTFSGGVYLGGTFHGGDFRAGVYYGGVYKQGRFDGTPLQMYGMLPLELNVAGPGLVAIGSRVNEIPQWRAEFAESATRGKPWAAWVMAFLDLAEIWLGLPYCPVRPQLHPSPQRPKKTGQFRIRARQARPRAASSG